MKYSVEDIYKHSGQFNKVVDIETKYGSESRKLFGNLITGSFVNTPKERKSLQDKINEGSQDRTDGLSRLHIILYIIGILWVIASFTQPSVHNVVEDCGYILINHYNASCRCLCGNCITIIIN